MKFIIRSKDEEYEFLLTPGLYVVGRDPTCDLAIDAHGVSRRHLSCKVTENEVHVKDLGSRNGTYIGSVEVKAATLKDGDELRLGEARLVFEVGVPTSALPPPPGEDAAAVSTEPVIESEEETPFDGALVPQPAAGVQPRLLERDGKMFVVDTATGREVEIVPAERAAARKPLLASGRGKLVVGVAVAVVVILFALAIRSALQPDRKPAMKGHVYQNLVDDAVKALGQDDVKKARALALKARAGMPKREAAKVLLDIVDLWEPWKQDFFKHWRSVESLLKELGGYDTTTTRTLFVRENVELIHTELRYSEKAGIARKAFENRDYEKAWSLVSDIPADSALGQKEADFIEAVNARFLEHIQASISAAEGRQDWSAAAEWATKLAGSFPARRDDARKLRRRFEEYQGHRRSIVTARVHVSSKNFEAARTSLSTIPADSPYRAEAERLLARAQSGELYAQASALYREGKGEEALALLKKSGDAAARSLARHIKSVLAIHLAGSGASEAKRLIEAERSWEALLRAETDGGNAYRVEALKELDRSSRLRADHARQLLKQADDHYKAENYREARNTYELALEMDPEHQIGQEALKGMMRQGRLDYRIALNLVESNRERALALVRRACGLLPADDPYYNRAVDLKKRVEKESSK